MRINKKFIILPILIVVTMFVGIGFTQAWEDSPLCRYAQEETQKTNEQESGFYEKYYFEVDIFLAQTKFQYDETGASIPKLINSTVSAKYSYVKKFQKGDTLEFTKNTFYHSPFSSKSVVFRPEIGGKKCLSKVWVNFCHKKSGTTFYVGKTKWQATGIPKRDSNKNIKKDNKGNIIYEKKFCKKGYSTDGFKFGVIFQAKKISEKKYNNILNKINNEKAVKKATDEAVEAVKDSIGKGIDNEIDIQEILNWGKDKSQPDNSLKDSACKTIPTKVQELLSSIFWIITIAGIILLMVLTILEFIKVITMSSEDGFKGAFKNTLIRIICVVILLLLPSLMNWIITVINDSSGGKQKIGPDGEPFCDVAKSE